MPIKNRIDMLTTGIRTPVGVKVFGADIQHHRADRQADRNAAGRRARHPQRFRRAHRRRLFPGRRPGTATQLARYGLTIDDAQAVVMSAIGGENVTTTVEGRERYPVNVRYMRDFRSDTGALEHVAGAGDGRPAADSRYRNWAP